MDNLVKEFSFSGFLIAIQTINLTIGDGVIINNFTIEQYAEGKVSQTKPPKQIPASTSKTGLTGSTSVPNLQDLIVPKKRNFITVEESLTTNAVYITSYFISPDTINSPLVQDLVNINIQTYLPTTLNNSMEIFVCDNSMQMMESVAGKFTSDDPHVDEHDYIRL